MTDKQLWQSYGITHVGCVRKKNEDNFIEIAEQGLWIVADGMGGMSFGETASEFVVGAFADFKRHDTLADNIDDLENRILKANYKCRSHPSVQSGRVMGSTVVALFFWKDKAVVLWVGDSRIYRLRDHTFEQLTTDHSLVQEMVEFGQISKAEAEFHPQSNIITRGVGIDDEIYVDMEYFSVKAGDKFVLCSDGLNKHLLDHEISAPLHHQDLEHTAKTLIDLALKGGGGDNVTLILVEVKDVP